MMNDHDTEQLEASMRPGNLSYGGFLGEKEKLDDVLKADDETVRKLGLTHEKIADRIGYFIKAMGCPTKEGKVIDEKYLIGGTAWRGGQGCPWEDSSFMEASSMDLYVKNLENKEHINFPGGIVHLIRKHHFYEGKESPYRVDPERIVKVLDIK